MIISISTAGGFQECRQKEWNWRELRLKSQRGADSLMTGAAFHAGLAAWSQSKDMVVAKDAAASKYNKELEGQMVLEEEREMHRGNILFAQNAVAQYVDHWKDQAVQVLMPEVKFRVELPNTTHHCWFVHRLLEQWADEPGNGIEKMKGFDRDPEKCTYKECFKPHFFTGTTDEVVEWNGGVWLSEHKTTSISGQMFYDRFQLDFQPTGYLYGIHRQTGIRPRGFILNVIKKPNKRAADRSAAGFEREAYLREDRELEEFERDIIRIAKNYEEAFRKGDIYKNTHSCVAYNRRCYYFDACKRGNVDEGEFLTRPNDYVDTQYLEVLSLEAPKDGNTLSVR